MAMLTERLVLVPRRHCGQKNCRWSGMLYHRAHSPCRVERCLDFNLTHQSEHRVREPLPAPGTEGE